jgi:hypothetical protein
LRPFLGITVPFDKRNQPIDLALSMHSAQPVNEPEQLELRRVIIDQPQFLIPLLGQQLPEQGRFADLLAMRGVVDAPRGELFFPGLATRPQTVVLQVDLGL